MWKKAGIDEKDYGLWYKLNEDTEIDVRISVGESKTEIIKNSVGQGSFGAALASSLNIGCAVQGEEICIDWISRTKPPNITR